MFVLFLRGSGADFKACAILMLRLRTARLLEGATLNLIDWLNTQARLRSRAKRDTNYRNNSREHRSNNNANDSGLDQDEKCPLGYKTKHLLSACFMYQTSTVDEKWEIVKQNNRCRKCLRAHHTNSCKKPDGTTCDKCTRRHHRSLHNEHVYVPPNSDQGTERLHPQTKVKKLVMTISRARQASPLFVSVCPASEASHIKCSFHKYFNYYNLSQSLQSKQYFHV